MPTADELLGPDVAHGLLAVLARAAPGVAFASTGQVAGELDGLALSGRAFALRDGILADLGGGLVELESLVASALADPAFDGWMTWPVGEAVAVCALADPAPDAFARGLGRLRDLTPRLTSEFAIRPFLQHDLDQALAIIQPWTADPDPAVRRLASEGTRPRLPWAKGVPELVARPEAAIPLLDALHRDTSEVVRRSVANHVNDVSRIRPELATQVCERWMTLAAPTTPGLVRHALRTLVKAADPAALALLGFGSADDLHVDGPVLAQTVVPDGGELVFSASVCNTGAEAVRVAVDYVMHFRKASGELAPKVFKLTTRTLEPGEVLPLTQRRSFKPLTTRRYYPGEHAVELQVNGRRSGR
ncbi:MAG: hypothetical protein JHD16_11920, partial [Solirubrobacteraceae bacterium]|nr:hypothetical protein [Solirubrobacteraceae bacterium]